MISDLRKRKLNKLFNVYDANGNGVFELDDLLLVFQAESEMKGWKPGMPEYEQYHGYHVQLWDYFRKFADANRDDRITLDEFVTAWDNVAREKGVNISSLPDWMQEFVMMAFDQIDSNDDGLITLEDYRAFLEVDGYKGEDVEDIFKKLDLNSDGFISKNEMLQIVAEFVLSDDPDAPGNLLYGKV